MRRPGRWGFEKQQDTWQLHEWLGHLMQMYSEVEV
jgi:hypothetical protein